MHTHTAQSSRAQMLPEAERGVARLLEESDRKDIFMATLAHELRNLIFPLNSALDLLEHAQHDPLSVSRVLPVARRQVTHMSHLVNDLLDVGRILRDEVLLAPVRLTLASLVSDTVESCSTLLARHVLRVDLGPEELWVRGDPVRLAQVLTNLLHNAAKFSPAGSTVSVRLERAGDQALLHVQDCGRGIVAGHIESVFDLFTQEPGAAAAAPDSLGIGLALVRRLTELHGGSVQATSDGPGRGTLFTVTLPLALEAE